MGKYIYLISVLTKFKWFLAFLIVLGIVFFFIVLMIATDEYGMRKIFKGRIYRFIAIALFIVAPLINILIPSKEDMTYILLSEKVFTKDNYQYSKKEIKEAVDYVIKKMNELEK